MTTSYTPAQPGSWLLLVTHDAVLYVEAAAADAVGELWAALGGAAPVQATLDILTRNGLGSAPSFALGHIVAGTLHALVRGPLALEATAAGGIEPIDGAGVSTWRETTVVGASALTFGAGTGQLPIGSGVAWASAFAFQPGTAPIAPADPLREAVAPAAPAAPAPVATPAPEPVAAAPAPEPEPAPAPVPPPAPVEPEPSLPSEHTMVEHTIIEAPEEPEPEPEPVVAPVTTANAAYSHLFEETVHRSIEEAAIREEPVEEGAPAPAPVVAALGDHDGETVMSADVAALRGRSKAPAAASTPVAVRSVYLELPNDQREPLTQPVIIGRSPSVSQVSGAELPRLVSIPGSQDISRSHARFALEGDTVVVTDLHSRNGTTIALPGKPAQLLRKGEPTAVLPGTVVDLGGVLTLTVREA